MFFHVSTQPYAVGAIIDPGHWGQLVRIFRPGGPMPDGETFPVLQWEMALETARAAFRPAAPSRLNCVFLVETLQEAQSFRAVYRPGATVYEVEPTSPDAPTFRGDFALISSSSPTGSYVDYMPPTAVTYWTTEAHQQPEIIHGGPVQVTAIHP